MCIIIINHINNSHNSSNNIIIITIIEVIIILTAVMVAEAEVVVVDEVVERVTRVLSNRIPEVAARQRLPVQMAFLCPTASFPPLTEAPEVAPEIHVPRRRVDRRQAPAEETRLLPAVAVAPLIEFVAEAWAPAPITVLITAIITIPPPVIITIISSIIMAT